MLLVNKGLLGLAAASAMVALVPQAAQAGTVVASSGPSARSYPVGAQIGNTQRIRLRQGDSLTVLDNGGTRVLRGPGTFILASQGTQASNNAFNALTSQGATRARTGAVRGEPKPVTNPNLYYVDVAATGTICLVDNSTISFWRSDTQAAGSYSVAGPEGSANIAFAEKEMLAQWQSDAGLSDGAVLTISGPGLDEATRVNFIFLEAEPADPDSTAQALIANGCTIQLDQLTTALAGG